MDDNRVRFSLPCDDHWLRFAHDVVKQYGTMVGFNAVMDEMFSSSVMEACEELFRLTGEAGLSCSVDLEFMYKGGAVVMDIDYDCRIPLCPHQAGDFEVPDEASDLDSLDTSSLWLHLIKRRMDRVWFMVRGNRRVLRLIKYSRSEGKEKQTWVMAVEPKLRKGLDLYLDDPAVEHPSGILQAKGRGVLKLGPSEIFLVRRMDGETSFHDLYMAHVDALGMISPKHLAALYEQLERMGMLADVEGTKGESSLKHLVKRIINPDFSIPNSDALVSAFHSIFRPMFSFWGLGLLLGIGLSGIFLLWENLHRFRVIVAGLEAECLRQPALILPLYLLILVHVLFHELGHGAVCKHYGGRVPRLGLMFYLTMFIFYCDTTAAWTFSSKRQRILVSLGGPIVSFAWFGAGLWLAGYFAGTGSMWEYVFVAFSLFLFFGLIMNFNPLIKMDAYYMLVDITGIADLRNRSFRFLEDKLFGWLGFGDRLTRDSAEIGHTPREKRIFWWYGVLGTLMTVFFLVIPILRLKFLLSGESVSRGRFFWALLMVTLLLARLAHVAFAKIKALRYREYKIQ